MTEEQYLALLNRVTTLENRYNDIVIALSRLVSLAQVQQLLAIAQTDLDALEASVEALDTRVTAIEEEPNE